MLNLDRRIGKLDGIADGQVLASRLVGAHLFAFGGLEPSARWLSAVQAGRFTLNQENTGFELWPE